MGLDELDLKTDINTKNIYFYKYQYIMKFCI